MQCLLCCGSFRKGGKAKSEVSKEPWQALVTRDLRRRTTNKLEVSVIITLIMCVAGSFFLCVICFSGGET
jgi:hypothetical protein